MVVKKKFEKKDVPVDAQEYISKGGKVQADMEENQEQWITISLRVPCKMLDAMRLRIQERAALTRTAWILEAIDQKLKLKDNNEPKSRETPS